MLTINSMFSISTSFEMDLKHKCKSVFGSSGSVLQTKSRPLHLQVSTVSVRLPEPLASMLVCVPIAMRPDPSSTITSTSRSRL